MGAGGAGANYRKSSGTAAFPRFDHTDAATRTRFQRADHDKASRPHEHAGTGGSNPLPSSGESTNFRSSRHYRRCMSDGSNYLDPNRPDAVRLGVSKAQ